MYQYSIEVVCTKKEAVFMTSQNDCLIYISTT